MSIEMANHCVLNRYLLLSETSEFSIKYKKIEEQMYLVKAAQQLIT